VDISYKLPGVVICPVVIYQIVDMACKMKTHTRIVLIFMALSISGFIVLEFFLYNYIMGLFNSSDDVILTIFVSAVSAFILTDFYLLTVFIITVIGYFISRFNEKEDYIKAFKYLSWIHLVVLILFSGAWIIG